MSPRNKTDAVDLEIIINRRRLTTAEALAVRAAIQYYRATLQVAGEGGSIDRTLARATVRTLATVDKTIRLTAIGRRR